jgi:hypothetical protein
MRLSKAAASAEPLHEMPTNHAIDDPPSASPTDASTAFSASVAPRINIMQHFFAKDKASDRSSPSSDLDKGMGNTVKRDGGKRNMLLFLHKYPE